MHCLLSLRGISSCRQRAKIEIFEHLQGQQVQKTIVFMNRSSQHMILHQNIELRNHFFTLFREVLGPMVTFPNLWRNGWKPSIVRWPIDHRGEELCFILPADISFQGKYDSQDRSKKCPRKSHFTHQILCLFKGVSNSPKSWIGF